MLQVKPLSTPIYHLGDDFQQFLTQNLKDVLKEKHLLAITSKVVSLAENRVLPITEISKTELVQKEADHYLGEIGYGCHLTIKHGLLIPSAGIDESNSEEGHYILYPKDPFLSAENIYKFLQKTLGLKQFGVLLTDSHTKPLRRGVLGTALAYYGFKGTQSKVGASDLFGRKLKMTHINVADALATAATYTMGESNEGQPLALIQATEVEFNTSYHGGKELKIPLKEDLYYPLLKGELSSPPSNLQGKKSNREEKDK